MKFDLKRNQISNLTFHFYFSNSDISIIIKALLFFEALFSRFYKMKSKT